MKKIFKAAKTLVVAATLTATTLTAAHAVELVLPKHYNHQNETTVKNEQGHKLFNSAAKETWLMSYDNADDRMKTADIKTALENMPNGYNLDFVYQMTVTLEDGSKIQRIFYTEKQCANSATEYADTELEQFPTIEQYRVVWTPGKVKSLGIEEGFKTIKSIKIIPTKAHDGSIMIRVDTYTDYFPTQAEIYGE